MFELAIIFSFYLIIFVVMAIAHDHNQPENVYEQRFVEDSQPKFTSIKKHKNSKWTMKVCMSLLSIILLAGFIDATGTHSYFHADAGLINVFKTGQWQQPDPEPPINKGSAWAGDEDFGAGIAKYFTYVKGDGTKEQPHLVDLRAGADRIKVGIVSVWDDQEHLSIRVQTDHPYVFEALHLYVGLEKPTHHALGRLGLTYEPNQSEVEKKWSLQEIDQTWDRDPSKRTRILFEQIEERTTIYIALHADIITDADRWDTLDEILNQNKQEDELLKDIDGETVLEADEEHDEPNEEKMEKGSTESEKASQDQDGEDETEDKDLDVEKEKIIKDTDKQDTDESSKLQKDIKEEESEDSSEREDENKMEDPEDPTESEKDLSDQDVEEELDDEDYDQKIEENEATEQPDETVENQNETADEEKQSNDEKTIEESEKDGEETGETSAVKIPKSSNEQDDEESEGVIEHGNGDT